MLVLIKLDFINGGNKNLLLHKSSLIKVPCVCAAFAHIGAPHLHPAARSWNQAFMQVHLGHHHVSSAMIGRVVVLEIVNCGNLKAHEYPILA